MEWVNGDVNCQDLNGPGEGTVMREEKKLPEDIPEYQPGDKIYELFSHDRVMVKGNSDNFIIKIV